MTWTSISDQLGGRGPARGRGGDSSGFSVVELLLGLSLTLCLAAAVGPLWLSLERVGVRESDQSVRLLQARVAVARLEGDLRLASAAGSPFPVSAPVLEASRSQVVFLERPAAAEQPVLVEWEIVNGSLMRRRGVCPDTRPAAFSHSLFTDHKTMLEGVKPGSALRYIVAGVDVDPTTSMVDPASVDGVVLELVVCAEGATSSLRVSTRGWVGR